MDPEPLVFVGIDWASMEHHVCLTSADGPIQRAFAHDAEGASVGTMIDEEAIDLLATRLKTPLQIEPHLRLAFEEAFKIGEAPVTAPIVECVLSRRFDDLEPRLIRHGYTLRAS